MNKRIVKKRIAETLVMALDVPLGLAHAKPSYYQLEPRQRIKTMAHMLRDRLAISPAVVRRGMLRNLRAHSAR
jgi:hypothetical protein